MTRMSARELVGHCASGALAGCAVESAFYPLDTLKTRMQAARAANARIELRGLYRGLLGNLMGEVGVTTATGIATIRWT